MRNIVLALVGVAFLAACEDAEGPVDTADMPVEPCDVDDGRCIFRHDTFGDEQQWTNVLRLHEVVQTLPPTQALAVGLKVDASAVPSEVLATADLEDPATTVALLELGAVIGIEAEVVDGRIIQIGTTCALCHSSVDDSVLPGVGNRLDGHPNRELDPGLIISLTPGFPDYAASLGVDPDVARDALASWGPGYYDPRFNQDGVSAPVLIPPAYGLDGVALATYTGDGDVPYWNNYVAVTQMGGQGTFIDEELGIEIINTPDRVGPKLPALEAYQLSLEAPAGTYDADAAARGQATFAGVCASCHAGARYTDAPTLHTADDMNQDATTAMRSKTGMYRSTPLRGLAAHPPYFHDGSAATLDEVIDHYEGLFAMGLTDAERADLVQYLLSL